MRNQRHWTRLADQRLVTLCKRLLLRFFAATSTGEAVGFHAETASSYAFLKRVSLKPDVKNLTKSTG